PLRADARRRLSAALEKAIQGSDGVFVSDYAKRMVDRGLLEDVMAHAGATGSIPVIVDPKSSDFRLYAGCTAITPNLREAEIATGRTIACEDDLREAAFRLRDATGASWILITMGEKGMALSGADGSLAVIPTRAREVYDVTGAGDTVLAYFGLGLATRMPAL